MILELYHQDQVAENDGLSTPISMSKVGFGVLRLSSSYGTALSASPKQIENIFPHTSGDAATP